MFKHLVYFCEQKLSVGVSVSVGSWVPVSDHPEFES